MKPLNRNDARDARSSARRCFLALAPLLVLLCFCVPSASATVTYEISLNNRQDHIFEIRMHIPNAAYGTKVAMPAWNALYQIRDFASRVRNITAAAVSNDGTSGGGLSVHALDKQTWQIGNAREVIAGKSPDELMVSYTIDWNDPSPFDTQLNAHHAFINFAEILMYVPERRGEDVTVIFDKVPAEWKIITALSASQTDRQVSAPSYDALVDAPVEAGEFGEFEFYWLTGSSFFRQPRVDKSKSGKRRTSGRLSLLRQIYRLRIEADGRTTF